MVKSPFAAQAMVTTTLRVLAGTVALLGVHEPAALCTCPKPAAVLGAVHPAGIVSWTCEPVWKLLPGSAVNVNVRVVVVPFTTLDGVTVMLPSPLLASEASRNVVCACDSDPLTVR